VTKHPILYEINTRCWLNELTRREGESITLNNVPEAELGRWEGLGFTHVWLMGVWSSGPRARAEALTNRDLRQHYSEVLPDWREEDVAGSPYAIADYEVPPNLGGNDGLQEFRTRLHARGLKLILDFVPNHLGLDHRWLRERPELFVQSPVEVPGTFPQQTAAGVRWLAYGKDPYFPPWTDTVQLDYRLAATRAAMADLLRAVASRCDGVRCDMAMLVLNEVFARTWGRLPGANQQPPSSEFWSEAISAVKRGRPDFLFLAEAYWGLEGRLRELGFDYAYDKTLYDKLVSRDAAGVQQHLLAAQGCEREQGRGQTVEDGGERLLTSSPTEVTSSVENIGERLLTSSPTEVASSPTEDATSNCLCGGGHLLENHDEPRIASLFSPAEQRAAALLILGLPGLRFLHEGQLSGARIRVPVQLLRRPAEPNQPEIERMYEQLLTALRRTGVGEGTGTVLVPCPAWPDNPTAQNIVAIQWRKEGSRFELSVTNLAPHRSQCYVPLRIPEPTLKPWGMKDLLGSEEYLRSGAELRSPGLYLDLGPHAAQLFQFESR
jgi:hypothetical protein